MALFGYPQAQENGAARATERARPSSTRGTRKGCLCDCVTCVTAGSRGQALGSCGRLGIGQPPDVEVFGDAQLIEGERQCLRIDLS